MTLKGAERLLIERRGGKPLPQWLRIVAACWDIPILAFVFVCALTFDVAIEWWFWGLYSLWIASSTAHWLFKEYLYGRQWSGLLRTQVYIAFGLGVMCAFMPASRAFYFLLLVPLASAALQLKVAVTIAVSFEAAAGYSLVMLMCGAPYVRSDPLDAASRFAFILGFAVFTYWASSLRMRRAAEEKGKSLLADIVGRLVGSDSAEGFLPQVLGDVLSHLGVSRGLIAVTDGEGFRVAACSCKLVGRQGWSEPSGFICGPFVMQKGCSA